jgi:hypothetical protein
VEATESCNYLASVVVPQLVAARRSCNQQNCRPKYPSRFTRQLQVASDGRRADGGPRLDRFPPTGRRPSAAAAAPYPAALSRTADKDTRVTWSRDRQAGYACQNRSWGGILGFGSARVRASSGRECMLATGSESGDGDEATHGTEMLSYCFEVVMCLCDRSLSKCPLLVLESGLFWWSGVHEIADWFGND